MVANCGATCAKYLLCLFNFTFFVSIFTLFFPICCAKIFYLESIVWQIACRKEKLLGTFQAYWSKKVSHIAIVGLFVEFIMYILTSKQFTVSLIKVLTLIFPLHTALSRDLPFHGGLGLRSHVLVLDIGDVHKLRL